MLKEAGSFFAIVMVLMVGAYFYIAGQGGNMNTLFSAHLTTTPVVSDYHQLAWQDAINAGISADLFERQINQESGFNPNAVSPAGAIGIAQIMPSTAAGWNVDPHDPVASLASAASAMAQYQTRYQSYAKALAAYNCGTATLDTAIARYGDNWIIGLPTETQNYIHAIMGA
jgi:soluble lytic murein transglycosylase-like protein